MNIWIDKLTESIENVATGDVFNTQISLIEKSDHAYLKTGWNFDWIKEASTSEVFKLFIEKNPKVIQGLISITDNHDHILVNLIENAHFNIG